MGVARLVEDYWTCGKRWDLEGYLYDHGHRWPKRPDGRPLCAAECCALLLHWLDERSSPSGRLDDVTPEVIERRARWSGKPGLFWEALLATRWIDKDERGHAWHDYYCLNGDTIAERNKKRRHRGDSRGDNKGGQKGGTGPGDKRGDGTPGPDTRVLGSGLSAEGYSGGGGVSPGIPRATPDPTAPPRTPTTTSEPSASRTPEPAAQPKPPDETLADALHAAVRGLRGACLDAAREWLAATDGDLAGALRVVAASPPQPFGDVHAYRRQHAKAAPKATAKGPATDQERIVAQRAAESHAKRYREHLAAGRAPQAASSWAQVVSFARDAGIDPETLRHDALPVPAGGPP